MLKKMIGISICMFLLAGSVFSVAGDVDSLSSIRVDDGIVLRCEVADASKMYGLPHKVGWSDDVVVAESDDDEYEPQIACAGNGDLFIVFENVEADKLLDVYKSEDDGKSWFWYTKWSAPGFDLTNPSIAIGEGDENWLFIACEFDDSEIIVLRQDLFNPSIWDLTSIVNDGLDVANPRIVTDSVEFSENWYPYLIYNKATITDYDAYALCFTESVNWGGSWTTPQYLHIYSDLPFYYGEDAHPDIGYGSGLLFIAFDDYDYSDNERDVYTIYSSDFGFSWSSAVKVADNDNVDEFDPSVAVVRGVTSSETAVIGYTHENSGNTDIYYAFTQNAGASWDKNNQLAASSDDEFFSDLATSTDEGAFHAVYWRDNNIIYHRADYSTPSSWTSPIIMNEEHAATEGFGASIVTNPLRSVENEAAITWTDERNSSYHSDIYFDSLLKEDPELPILELQNIDGGLLGITVELINSGEAPAYDITWELQISEGMLGPINTTLFMPLKSSGIISELAAGEGEILSASALGLGQATVEFYCDYSVILDGARNELDVTVKQEWRDQSLFVYHSFPEDKQPTKVWRELGEHEYEYTFENDLPAVKFNVDGQPLTMHNILVRNTETQNVKFRGACKLTYGQGILYENWITKNMVENGRGIWEVELVTH